MAETWTIRKVIDWTAKDLGSRGIESPRVDAELLVAEALKLERVRLYMELERPLSTDELGAIRGLLSRRRQREPVAYILGRRDFYGATFAVDSRVLIPRPDTEILVERALTAIPEVDASVRILDLCTGSGAVPISLLRVRPNATALGTDLSEGALEVARANAVSLGVETRFETSAGDLFAAVPADARFDVITANPPYIASLEVPTLMPEVARHEPRLALDGGEDGLTLYPAIIEGAKRHLVDSGMLALELGAGQAPAVAALVERANGFADIAITKDYGGVERVVSARRLPR